MTSLPFNKAESISDPVGALTALSFASTGRRLCHEKFKFSEKTIKITLVTNITTFDNQLRIAKVD